MIYLCLALLALFGLPFLFSSAIGIFVQMTIGLSMMRGKSMLVGLLWGIVVPAGFLFWLIRWTVEDIGRWAFMKEHPFVASLMIAGQIFCLWIVPHLTIPKGK